MIPWVEFPLLKKKKGVEAGVNLVFNNLALLIIHKILIL